MRASDRQNIASIGSMLLLTAALAIALPLSASEHSVTSATAEMLVITDTAPETDRALLDKLAATLAADHVET